MNKKKSILIVEDESIIAADMERCVEGLGYAVASVVSSGREAIQKAEELRPDLVLMDIVLRGDMDGIEAAEKIQSRFSIPVVYVTAHVDEKRIRNAKRTEPFGYILKPFADKELMVTVELALYKHEIDQKLKESEAKYRSLVENTSVGITAIDIAGNFVFVNQKMCDMIGYKEEEMFGRNYASFLHPDDTSRILEIFQQAVQNPGKRTELEYRVVHKDGHAIHCYSVPTVFMKKGKIDGFNVIVINITERKWAEAAMLKEHTFTNAILNTAGALIVVYDREKGIVRFNKACMRKTGYSFEEVKGKRSWDLLIVPGEKKKVKAYFKTMRAGMLVKENENHWLAKDGSQLLVAWSNTVLLDAEDNVEHIISIGIDITERKRAEEENVRHRTELRNLTNQLIRTQEAERKKLSRELHDEMGQALTAVKINLSMFQKQLGTDVPEDIGERLKETDTLVDTLLDQTHELALDLHPSILDDLGLVPTLRWYSERFAHRSDIKVKFETDDIEGRLDPEIETVLYRTAQETLTNIAKHAEARHVKIRLRKRKSSVELTVKDDGKGFDLEKVTLHEEKKHRVGLLGMRERVASVGGIFRIETNPGRGTKLLIQIPLGERT
ncbi:MAG: PAS domain S-box protein [bacterium]